MVLTTELVLPRIRIRIYEPLSIPDKIAEEVEKFRIPRSDFSSEEEWLREVTIDRTYGNRSVTIVAFSAVHQIYATSRIVIKRTQDELLPIEFSKVIAVTDPAPELTELSAGNFFRLPSLKLPLCEIGGLRTIDRQDGVSIRDRHYSLYMVAKQCETEVYKRGGIRTAFLTCAPSQNVVKLYGRFQFSEIGEVTYSGKDRWKTLWRWPYRRKDVFATPILNCRDAFSSEEASCSVS